MCREMHEVCVGFELESPIPFYMMITVILNGPHLVSM